MKTDLIQFFNFEKYLYQVIKAMRKEDDDQKKKSSEFDQFEDEISRF